MDLEEWVEAALDREDVALRCVAVALLAAVYHAPMYLLLHKALIDSDEAVREAAWRVVAQPVVARTADGE